MEEVKHQEQFAGQEDNTADENFEAQDFAAPSFITLARIYDLLAIIALSLDPDGAEEVLDMHEKGLLKGAMPMLVVE